MPDPARNHAVGIDLGTTYSVVAHLDHELRPATISNAEGDLTTPSVVFLDPLGAVVGKEAVKAVEFEPQRIAQFPKRDMGLNFFRREVRGEKLPPEVLQAMILRKLKQDAEMALGPVQDCVITVPAYFNEPRRKGTQDAGRMAGWKVLDIINEPTAAAIAYGVRHGFLSPERGAMKPEKILVYDLGGGTFDVTIMQIEQNRFTAIATAGDVELGGIDWDNRILDYMIDGFRREHGVDLRDPPDGLIRLRHVAEEAKRTLSTRKEAPIQIAVDGQRLRLPLTRELLEEMTGDLVERTLLTLRKLTREAKVEYSDLTRLLVVGGSTRMPMIAEALTRETGHRIDRAVSADEAVAHGAAIYAHYLRNGGGGFTVQNVSSHDLGVLAIEKATGRPRRKTMIARNSPLPANFVFRFATQKLGQRDVVVNVVEGGDASGNGATQIGRCIVSGLPRDLPAQSPVDVRFQYAENGRLDVHANLPSIAKAATLTIERASGMNDADITAWSKVVAIGLPDGYQRPDGIVAADLPKAMPLPPTPAMALPLAAPLNAAAPLPQAIPLSMPVTTPQPAAENDDDLMSFLSSLDNSPGRKLPP